MGKRKKLELQTRRRQKLCLSVEYSEDENDYDDEMVTVPATTQAAPASSVPQQNGTSQNTDDTLAQFLKEINDLEQNNQLENGSQTHEEPNVDYIWQEGFDDYYGRYYYYNSQTNESTWVKPDDVAIKPHRTRWAQKPETTETSNVENEDGDRAEQKKDEEPVKVDSETASEKEPNEVDNNSANLCAGSSAVDNGNESVPQTDDFEDIKTVEDKQDLEDDCPSSPAPSDDDDNVNVIINNPEPKIFSNIMSLATYSDSNDSDEELNQFNVQLEKQKDIKEDSFEAVDDEPADIDIDAALESAVDADDALTKKSEIKLKELVEQSVNMLCSKFEYFDLILDSVPTLLKIFITFHVQRSNYEKNYFSAENYLECLQSISKSLDDYEKSISPNERLELRWNNETSSYLYFDKELKSFSDIKPEFSNLKNQTYIEQPSCNLPPPEPVYSPPPPLPKESEPIKSPPPPPPPPLSTASEEIDVIPTSQENGNSIEDISDGPVLASNRHEEQSKLEDKISLTSKPESINSAEDTLSENDPLAVLPPEIEKLRDDINDPKRQYKVYKKLKKFARQQAKANGGSRHELLTRLWSKLNQSTTTDSPAASLTSSRSQSPEVVNYPVEDPAMDEVPSHQHYSIPESSLVIDNESNQTTVFGPQFQHQQNYDVLRESEMSNVPPPPPPPTIEEELVQELDPEVSKSPSPEAEPGVVYCLPAHVPQIALNDLPEPSKDVKKSSKSNVQHTSALQTKKMKASISNSTASHKFKNKNMSKLVDKWTKVKKEIDEDPEAIEGDYYFEPQSIEKMRQSQMRYDQSNPNLIKIDDTKNKMKAAKSTRR